MDEGSESHDAPPCVTEHHTAVMTASGPLQSEQSLTLRAADLAWELTDDGFAVVACGTFADANPAFCRLVGRSVSDIVGLALDDIFAPDDVAPFVESTHAPGLRSVAGLLADGRPFLADLSVTRTSTGELLIRARHRRPVVVTNLEQPAVGKNEVATALSHDVRGRLGVVSGFIGMITENDAETRGDSPPDPLVGLLHRAESATGTVDQMLERLVRYIRLGDAVFHLTPTALNPVVTEAASLAGIDISLSGDPLPTTFANASMLTECVTELFRNAAEFGRDDVALTVDVSARRVGDWCELVITDNGRGIAPHLVEESFALFRQLQSRNWERGVGMGLAICRRIIDGHGGTITVHGDGTAGTTIVLRLAPADSPS